jgi:hypothetical protein
MLRYMLASFLCVATAQIACADDWPTLGRDRSRNSVSPERNPPNLATKTTGCIIDGRCKCDGARTEYSLGHAIRRSQLCIACRCERFGLDWHCIGFL